MRHQFLLLAVIISSLAVCGCKKKKKAHSSPPAPAQNPAPPPRQGPSVDVGFGNSRSSRAECPTANDTSLDPVKAVQRHTMVLKKERQMVVRKNCDGHVIKRGIEVVTSPQGEVTIKPSTRSWTSWWKSLGGNSIGYVFNRTTCTQRGRANDLLALILLPLFPGQAWTMLSDGVASGSGFPRIRSSINTSPTTFDMHVRRDRDNYLDYEFATCLEKAGDGSCTKLETWERGTLILTVDYREPTEPLPGELEVFECQKDEQQLKP